MQDWAAVHKVYKQTGSKRKTSRILDIARNTVKRQLLEMTEVPKYYRKEGKLLNAPYKDQIIQWRCDSTGFNGIRIFRELKKIGYEDSISPLYRFLRRVD